MSISLHLDMQDVLNSLQHIKAGWKISARTNRQTAFLMRQIPQNPESDRRQLVAESSRCTSWIVASEHVRILSYDIHSETTLVSSLYRL
jgi:hypothetical protein